ncbi:hypothetical protein L6Q96_07260 [Candidatus Binatia bacterium]|nr:hypothetical protein [Candidatus Binatia bacterium]
MNISVALVDGTALDEVLNRLLPAETELPYANFAPIAARPGAIVELHRGRWLAAGERIEVLAAYAGDRPLGAVRIEHRPFESDHFGLRMARIDQPIAVNDCVARRTVLRELYAAAFDSLRGRGYRHVSSRASANDSAASWVLQELGAFHVDTQVSWMSSLDGPAPADNLAPGLTVEILDKPALRRLDRESWRQVVEWTAQAFERGPLVFDHTLPRDRAAGVYGVWAERAMCGDWADAVCVVRDGSKIVAFGSMLLLADVSAHGGVRVCGRGLAATLPKYRGLFTAIHRELIVRKPLGAQFAETDTQVTNLGSVNVCVKLGFRCLRVTSTFSRRLDQAAAGTETG